MNRKHTAIACTVLAILGSVYLLAVQPAVGPAPRPDEKATLPKAVVALRRELRGLPVDKQAELLVSRLPEVRGTQLIIPGHCALIGCGEGTAVSDELVALGRSAMPSLVANLNDTRPTTSRDEEGDGRDLLAQDVVIQCIEQIVRIGFHDPSLDSHLSNKPPAARAAVIKDIADWWTEFGEKSELEGFQGRLNKGNLYQKMTILASIENLDPKAVDSRLLLKDWYLSADWQMKPRLALALAQRGDLSTLPEIRNSVRDPIRTIPNEAVWYLVQYGDADDIRFLHAASLREIATGANLGSARIWGSVYAGVRAYPRPLVVPILVDLLKQREFTGSRFVRVGQEDEGFCPADTCIEALITLTKHDEGYDPGARREQRLSAIDRWLAWWNREGRAEYLKAHPEVAAALPVAFQAARPADIADLPPVLELEDPDELSPITYRVARSKVATLQKLGMLHVVRDELQTRYRMTTAAAVAIAVEPEASGGHTLKRPARPT